MKRMEEILKIDVEFLKENEFYNYTLMVGIHQKSKIIILDKNASY